MRFEPLGEKILVEPTPAETKTASGLIIPDVGQDTPQTGKVLAIGPDVKVLGVGDVVMFGKFAGLTVKVDGKERLIMDLPEVFGKVVENA